MANVLLIYEKLLTSVKFSILERMDYEKVDGFKPFVYFENFVKIAL